MPRINRRDFLASALAIPAGAACRSPRLAAAEPKRFPFFEPVEPPRPVQAMVHRGMAMLAPENTARAVEECAADFVEWAEVDVRLTRDGRHVVFHDGRLDGKTDGKGPVDSLALAELQKLDAGAWFAPRFKGARLQSHAEVLALAKGKVNLYLDCKSVDPELLVKEVRAAGMEKQVVVYDAPAVIAAVRKASGGAVATMTKYRPGVDFAAFMRDGAPNAVEVDADDVTAELCKKFRAAGVVVQAKVLGAKWDNPETWRKMIDAGVEWLQTDDPAGVLTTAARKRMPKWPVMVSYHRGANRYAPENTLPAIKAAVALGADFVEIDVRTTRDGKLVLMHDSAVDRTTDGKGKVRDLTLAEIQKLDAGSWFGKPFAGTRVPTLDEALAALGGRAGVYLDAKDVALEEVLAAVKAHDLFERHVVYQSAEFAAKLKKLDARLRPLPPLKAAGDLAKVAAVKPYGVDAAWRVLSRELIADCHAKGVKVFSDALGLSESVKEYRKAIGWGLDVIQTDHPLRVLRAVELESRP